MDWVQKLDSYLRKRLFVLYYPNGKLSQSEVPGEYEQFYFQPDQSSKQIHRLHDFTIR